MTDARLDFALPIRVLHAAGQGDGAIMLQHVAIERIECGIVNVGRDHAFAEIIEDHDASHAAQSAKRFLVQLCPDPRAGAKHQQAN